MAVYYIYLLFFMFLGALRVVFKVNHHLVLLIVGLLLIFMAAFRAPDIGRDYENYLNVFRDVKNPIEYFTNYSYWYFFEPGFYFIIALVKFLSVPYYEIVLFFIFALIGVFVNLKAISKMSDFPVLSVIFFFSLFFLLQEMTQIRAGIACGLFLLCIHAYFNKQMFRFFTLFLLAILFHYAAFLTLLILLFHRDKFSLNKSLLVLLCSIVLAVLKLDVLVTLLSGLNLVFIQKMVITLQSISEEDNVANVFNVSFLINLAVTLFLILHHKQLRQKNKYAILLLKVQLTSILCYCAFSSFSMLSFRLYEFLGIVNVITVPFLAHCIPVRVVSYTAIILYSLLLIIINLHVVHLIGGYKLVFFS